MPCDGRINGWYIQSKAPLYMINSWMQGICHLVVNSGVQDRRFLSSAKLRKATGIRASIQVNRFYKNRETTYRTEKQHSFGLEKLIFLIIDYYSATNSTGATQRFSTSHKTSLEQKN